MYYPRGTELIVFKVKGSTSELRREFKRILQFGRLDNLTMKQLKKIKTKTVYCASEDTVQFTDGTIYWSSSVAKPGELRAKLKRYTENHKIPIKRKKGKESRIKKLFNGANYRF
ncbi:hypothetical protein ACFLY2_03650 [Patescibacteria group bacterium]